MSWGYPVDFTRLQVRFAAILVLDVQSARDYISDVLDLAALSVNDRLDAL